MQDTEGNSSSFNQLEGKKVARNKGDKYQACYVRIERQTTGWKGFAPLTGPVEGAADEDED